MDLFPKVEDNFVREYQHGRRNAGKSSINLSQD